MKILDYKSKDAVTAPVNVVQTDEKGKYVFVIENAGGKSIVRKKPVTVGETYGGVTEIKSGLGAGALAPAARVPAGLCAGVGDCGRHGGGDPPGGM